MLKCIITHTYQVHKCRSALGQKKFCTLAIHESHLFVLLHGGIKLLGQIVRYIRHSRLLLVRSTHAAFVFICLLVVFLLSIFAVTWDTLRGIYSRSINICYLKMAYHYQIQSLP